MLVQQSSIDGVFTSEHGIDASIASPPRDAWQAQVEASLAAPVWLFSGDVPYHTLALGDSAIHRPLAGTTLAMLLAQFWVDGAPTRAE